MAGVLELVHHHPGRLRVRSEAFRLEPEVVDRVREAVEGLPGITKLTHSARTGSILVEYEPGFTEPDQVVERIAAAANLERPNEDEVRAKKRPPALLAVGVARELNELTKELTGSEVDLRLLVPTALAALGAYSLAYGKEPRLPRWDNLLYWSYNIFVTLHRREIDATAAPDQTRRASLRPIPESDPP